MPQELKRPKPQSNDCFIVSTPTPTPTPMPMPMPTPTPAPVSSGGGPADIWSAQSGRKEFRGHSDGIFSGATVLEGKISPDSIANIHSFNPPTLPTSDLKSQPGPLRWFVNPYCAHAPAALIHDWLTGIENGPPELTDAQVNWFFRVTVEAVGLRRLRRWIRWAAVAFRTTRRAIA